MKHKKEALAGAIAVAFIIAVAVWLGTRPDSAASEKPPPVSATQAASIPEALPAPEQAIVDTGENKRPRTSERHLDTRARDALLTSIVEARSRRLLEQHRQRAAGSDHRTPVPLAIVNKTGSTSEWEERQLQTLRELLGECYDLAADEQPGLSGTFGLQFSIAAEPDIGGLVDAVTVMEEYSSIDDLSMRECMLHSIYALELDPPPEGMRVDREITLRFDPE